MAHSRNVLLLTQPKPFLPLWCGLVWLLSAPSLVLADDVFEFRFASKPFSQSMCKQIHTNTSIRLAVAHHRAIVLRKVSGQYVPSDRDEARKKDYVHSVALTDLTNGEIDQGAIAFDQSHAVIFQGTHPNGISRSKFRSQFQKDEQPIVDSALNTFLRLHSIFNAAVDACRPYPTRITYDTNDEIDRIEKGRLNFIQLVQQYNNHPTPTRPLYYFESGMSQGFVDPEAGKHSNVSYQAMNPLNFYVPTTYP